MPADRAWFERSHAFHFSVLGSARIESESIFATPSAVVVEAFLRLGDRSLDFPIVAIRSVTLPPLWRRGNTDPPARRVGVAGCGVRTLPHGAWLRRVGPTVRVLLSRVVVE